MSTEVIKELDNKVFPSPYGVIFILTKILYLRSVSYNNSWFPSPYGVSFILIKQNHIFIEVERYFGFRLLMELYSFLHTSNLYCHFIDNQFPSPYGVIFILTEISKRGSWFRYRIVSVSLWSIIHSYCTKLKFKLLQKSKKSFRLLMEYHSFL